MITHLHNSQKDLSLSQPIKEKISQLVTSVIALELKGKSKPAEVNLYFVSDAKMRKLHKEHFNDPSSTDCMSFPLDDDGLLGEIIICPNVAIEYAAKHKKNPYDELALYIVHGLLHLVGYDDLTVRERKKMRRSEKKQIVAATIKGILPLLP